MLEEILSSEGQVSVGYLALLVRSGKLLDHLLVHVVGRLTRPSNIEFGLGLVQPTMSHLVVLFQEEGEVSGPPWKHQPQRLLRSDLSAPSAFGQGLVAIMFGPHYKNRLGESSQGVAEGEVRQLALMSAGVIVERDGLLELFD